MTIRSFLKDPLLTVANHRYLLVASYLASLVAGATIFHFLENRTLVESLYWAVVSGTSTGFGDITPKTEAGMLFTTIYLLWTIPVLASLVTAFIVEHLRQDPNSFTDEEQKEILHWVREQRAEADRKRQEREGTLIT